VLTLLNAHGRALLYHIQDVLGLGAHLLLVGRQHIDLAALAAVGQTGAGDHRLVARTGQPNVPVDRKQQSQLEEARTRTESHSSHNVKLLLQ
jgi:hypothetical protein